MDEKSEIKKRALLAKRRLQLGFWERLSIEQASLREKNVPEDKIRYLRAQKIQREIFGMYQDEETRHEQMLYEKVCAILDRDEDAVNPIGQLIDKEKYRQLDDAGRQRYVLELSAKFRELSRRYYIERESRQASKKS